VARVHSETAQNEKCLRISMDTKAKVKVGELSRGGKSRAQRATKALDHDTQVAAILVPFGILEVACDQLSIIFGTSRETSDFIVDGMQLWWDQRKAMYPHISKLQVDLDNGPDIASHRTQFIKRLVEFADFNQLVIELAYYPPYHSKYNPIERCWGILEEHWNGSLLDTTDTVLQWAKTMNWNGISPIVRLLEQPYEGGVRLTKKALRPFEQRLQRSDTLPKWSIVVQPQHVW